MTHLIYMNMLVISSVVFVEFLLYNAIGGGGDTGDGGDTDDVDTNGFLSSVFTIKAGIGFFLGFSLGGLKALDEGLIGNETLRLAFATGGVFLVIVALVIYGTSKLSTRDYVKLDDTVIGNSGTVTIRIEPGSVGKVNVNVGSSLREVFAKTIADDTIGIGSRVKVVQVDGDVLLVELEK